jgi:uncharacterized protein YebE (UPF0316 family)
MFNFDISIIKWCVIIFFVLLLTSCVSTLKVIFLVKGKRALAIIINFFEAAIGLSVAITVISNAVKSGINFFIILFYALGAALGLFLGMIISQKFSKNFFSVNIVSKQLGTLMEDLLRKNGFGVSCYTGSGKEGGLKSLNVICKKADLVRLNSIVSDIDNKVMVASHEIEGLSGGFIFGIKNRF